MGKYYYSIMWLTIGIISAIDVYWSVVNQNILWEEEKNPIGRYLIEADNGSIALFMAVKFAGTVMALGALVTLYHWKPKYAWPIIITLTIIQFCLLSYLSCNQDIVIKTKADKWQRMNTSVKPVNTSSRKKSR